MYTLGMLYIDMNVLDIIRSQYIFVHLFIRQYDQMQFEI